MNGNPSNILSAIKIAGWCWMLWCSPPPNTVQNHGTSWGFWFIPCPKLMDFRPKNLQLQDCAFSHWSEWNGCSAGSSWCLRDPCWPQLSHFAT
jgi:hypothetical protein